MQLTGIGEPDVACDGVHEEVVYVVEIVSEVVIENGGSFVGRRV